MPIQVRMKKPDPKILCILRTAINAILKPQTLGPLLAKAVAIEAQIARSVNVRIDEDDRVARGVAVAGGNSCEDGVDLGDQGVDLAAPEAHEPAVHVKAEDGVLIVEAWVAD